MYALVITGDTALSVRCDLVVPIVHVCADGQCQGPAHDSDVIVTVIHAN